MSPGRIVLFGIFILGLIFLFRLVSCFSTKKGSGFLFKLIYLSILVLLAVYFYFVRIHLGGSFLTYLSGTLLIFGVSGEIIPSSGPSGPSRSSSPWTEDSFGIEVLQEPFSETEMEGNSSMARDEAGPSHQTAIFHNSSLESSIRNRVLKLENEGSIFLLDKEKGQYWADVKKALDQAPDQIEYNRLLDFESRDLQIRELKHRSYSLFHQVLSEHPSLSKNAAYAPGELFTDFVDEKRKKLDEQEQGWNILITDQRELLFLNELINDLQRNGRNADCIRTILNGA